MNPIRHIDQVIDEFFLARTCATCKKQHPTQAYPMLTCEHRTEYVPKYDRCVRWEEKK